MAQTTLPPGFRFHPTDVELVAYYLKRKIMGKKLSVEAISECELYKYAPWDLPGKSLLRSRDLEWYFFCPRGKKYPNGSRSNRGTPNGYWKTSGKDRTIMLNSRIVGMKKTLIFHEGKAPKGGRTDWVMYEYRMDNDMEVAGFSKDSYMLCKIFKKSGLGPKIGEQYGAPFNEEEWEEDVDTETSMFPLMSCPSSELVDAVEELPVLHTVTAEQSLCEQATPGAASEPPSQLGGTEVVSADHTPNAVDAYSCPASDGFLLEELAMFLNNSPYRDSSNGKLADFPAIPEAEAQALQINSDDIYNELEELLESGDVSTVNYPLASYMSTAKHIQPIFSQFGSSGHFLELNDLVHVGETSTSELCAPKNIFPQYPLEQCPYNQLNHGNCDNGLAASFAAGNFLPTFPCTMHDLPVVDDNSTFTSDLMDTDDSNPTMHYPFS